MTQDERQFTEGSPTANIDVVICETETKPFKLTVELPLFLTMMSSTLSGAPISNLILYRTCYHSLDYSKIECAGFLSLDRTNETDILEQEVQRYATYVSTARGIIAAVVPAILTCFLGVWSNTHGRKPLLVWPLLGIAMSAILMVVYSIIDTLGPWWYLLTAIPYSLTGGIIVLSTGAYCYMSDISSTEYRSFRIMILGATASLGSVIGSIISPHVLRGVGNVYLLTITAVLNVVAYLFTRVCLQESVKGAVRGTILSVLSLLLVKEMIRVCFKRRSNKGRMQILLLTLANSVALFVSYGIPGLEYLYTRQKLQWSLQDFTSFSAVHTAIAFVGAFFGIAVVQRRFGVTDLTLINVAFLSAMIEHASKAMATQTWHMYLGSVLALFRGLSSALLLSLFTKILPLADIAKMIALLLAIEGLWQLVAPVVYNSLYAATLATFPASIYVLSIAFTTVCIVSTGMVQYYRWNVPPHQRFNN